MAPKRKPSSANKGESSSGVPPRKMRLRSCTTLRLLTRLEHSHNPITIVIDSDSDNDHVPVAEPIPIVVKNEPESSTRPIPNPLE